jgi:hypothetical protein
VQRTKSGGTVGSVRDKNLGFCPVPWFLVYPVPETDLKSNTVQLKLSCTVSYFIANQTHPKLDVTNTTCILFISIDLVPFILVFTFSSINNIFADKKKHTHIHVTLLVELTCGFFNSLLFFLWHSPIQNNNPL